MVQLKTQNRSRARAYPILDCAIFLQNHEKWRRVIFRLHTALRSILLLLHGSVLLKYNAKFKLRRFVGPRQRRNVPFFICILAIPKSSRSRIVRIIHLTSRSDVRIGGLLTIKYLRPNQFYSVKQYDFYISCIISVNDNNDYNFISRSQSVDFFFKNKSRKKKCV